LQFPVLEHEGKILPDSSTIFQYLHDAFPDKMALFTLPDAKT
jgi:glutathione S-transferase